MPTQIPDTKEKIGAALAYLTFGIWGLVWLLLSRTPAYFQKDFVRFHCFQSIFIGILYMFIPTGLSIFFSLITQILALIPNTDIFINGFNIIHYSFQQAVYFGGLVLIMYCVIFSIYGKFTNIPFISQMINRMLR